jgi:O-antigen ligase
MVLAIAIVLLFLRISKRLKLIISGSIVFFFVTALISFVRAALISMFVLIAVLTIAKRPRRTIFVILILFGIGLLPYMSFVEEYIEYNFPNISSISDIRYMSTIRFRENAWRAGLKMIKDYPILGIGTGLWDEYIPKYGPMQPVVISVEPLKMGWGYINDPHNFYIKIALDSGLTGFIALISILVIIFKNAIKIVLFTKEESRYYLTLGSIAGLLSYLTWGLSGARFVDEGLSNIGPGIFFFSLGAIVIKLSHFEKVTS